MDGMDGKDDNQSMDGTDRRQGWNQDPSGGTQDQRAQNRRDEQASYGPAPMGDPREVPAVLPGRFLRNPGAPTPPTPQRPSMPPIPAEDATPTRSVPVLSRPGYQPIPSSAPGFGAGGPTPNPPAPSIPAPSASVERAAVTPATSAAPSSGYGEPSVSVQQPASASALPYGAYVVEETQEMLVTPPAGSPSPSASVASSPAPRWPGAAQPGRVNPVDAFGASPGGAAGASPGAYPPQEQTGSYSAVRPQPTIGSGDASARAASGPQNGIATSGPDRSTAWTSVGMGAGQMPSQGTSQAQGASWRRQDQWQQDSAAQAGSYAATPAPAASRGYGQRGAAGGAAHVLQRARAGGLAQAATSFLGPEEDQGTVAILLTAAHAAALSYLFGFLSGIFFYFGERENRYLRFHAMQSIILSAFMIIVGLLVYFGIWLEYVRANDPFWNVASIVIGVIILIALLAIWLWTMAKAWMGHYVYLPIISFLTALVTPHDELLQDQGA